jgi:Zn-dependent peptidase ImmA (M78 family)
VSPAGQRAEALIAELGISRPAEIDVEAIAQDSGVSVRYAALNGCEASLVGYADRAIATVNPSGVRGRERFSVAHEVGHWHLHRGRSFQCRVDDADFNLASDRAVEKEADTFAAHLLMPEPIFAPRIRQIGRPGFKQLGDLAQEFETSLMATALRLADINTLPVIVAAVTRSGMRWSLPAGDIPKRWFLRRELDEDSFTYDLLCAGKECRHLGKQPADVWFQNADAGKYELWEQCVASRSGEALVLLYLEPKMLAAGFDWNVARRYNDRGSYVPKGRRQ